MHYNCWTWENIFLRLLEVFLLSLSFFLLFRVSSLLAGSAGAQNSFIQANNASNAKIREPDNQKPLTNVITVNKKKQNILVLPILAPLTLHHEVIWVIRHLALAIPSKHKTKLNQQNKTHHFKHLKHKQHHYLSKNRNKKTYTATRSGVKAPVAALYSNLQ